MSELKAHFRYTRLEGGVGGGVELGTEVAEGSRHMPALR